MKLMQQITALVSGILFGLGLGLSQMIDRERVLGFLDVKGNWDPTLLFVLGGAVSVTLISFRFILRFSNPCFDNEFHLPSNKNITLQLIVGAALFGIGWGISGYCPGPGIAAFTLGIWNPILFVLALILGSMTYHKISSIFDL